jgi:hypothetical protein
MPSGRFLLLAMALANARAQIPEQKAAAYLSREVPAWNKENRCYSCHNNGVGAWALYEAKAPADALRDTTQWLEKPGQWDSNHGDPGFSDKKLARIQFAAALLAAVDSGVVRDHAPLRAAAAMLLRDQSADGSWKIEGGAELGSPSTWGNHLATWVVRRILVRAEADGAAADRASAWLMSVPVHSTLDAAIAMLAGRPFQDVLVRGQNPDGGWGPYPKTPSEAFDTALALLALRRGAAVDRGRRFLAVTQMESGGWPETTRPAGGRSYAQHISTTGWALLALLETGHGSTR